MTWKITGAPGTGDDLLYSQAGTPTLDLRFASSKSLDDNVSGQNLIDFTRGGNGVGTYVGSDGLIKNSVVNLLTYSEEWNLYQTIADAVVDVNEAIAPDRTLTGDKIRCTGTTANSGFVQKLYTSVSVTSLEYTGSWYFKQGNTSKTLVELAANGGVYTFARGEIDWSITPPVFKENSKTGGTAPTFHPIVDVGNGWYKVAITITANNSTNISSRIYASDRSSPIVGDYVYAWGAQLEQSDTVGEYVKTTSSISGAPRFDHDPATGESLGLLIEEQRTNFALSSASFQPTSGGSPAAYVVDQVAPDGTTSGSRQTAAAPRTFTDYLLGANAQYTFSVYVKGVGEGIGQLIRLQLKNASSDTIITTGAFFALTSTWTRISVTGTTNGATTGARIEVLGSTLGAPPGTVFWGAQLEAGAFPTSYIPTTSTAVTRNADVASITGDNFSSWYRQSEGTVFSEYISDRSTTNRYSFALSDGTTNNRFLLFSAATSALNARLVASGVGANPGILSLLPTGSNKVCLAAATGVDNVVAASNGILSSAATTSAMPLNTVLYVGAAHNGLEYLNGTISRLAFFDRRLPNATLQAITG